MSRTIKFQLIAAIAALATVSGLVLYTSHAAFSGTTDTSGNWDAATVALSGTSSTAFTSGTNLVPNDTDQECITVTYDGNADAAVKMYGSTTFSSTEDLGKYLDLTIEEVTTGAGTCATPDSVDSTLFSTNTLSVNTGAFTVAHTDWSNGLATTWDSSTPATNGATKEFRLTVTVKDDNNAQSQDTTGTFTWEAQNL